MNKITMRNYAERMILLKYLKMYTERTVLLKNLKF